MRPASSRALAFAAVVFVGLLLSACSSTRCPRRPDDGYPEKYPAYFHGVIVPMITPYKGKDAAEVDLDAVERFTDYLCGTRVAGLFPCAGMGQWPKLSVEEKKGIISRCVKTARGRKPVLAGVGSDHDIGEVLEVARHAEKVGADAIVVVTPSFIRREQPKVRGRRLIRDQKLLLDYYTTVACSVTIPVVVYDPKPEMAPETMASLLEACPNVKGMKFRETKDMEKFRAMVDAVKGRVAVLSGSEYVTVQTMQSGGVGVVGGGPNVYPDLLADLVETCRERDWPRAWNLQRKVSEACDMMGRLSGGGLGAKRILNDVVGVRMEWSNRGETPRPEGRSGQYDAVLDYFREMNLPKYEPAQSPGKAAPDADAPAGEGTAPAAMASEKEKAASAKNAGKSTKPGSGGEAAGAK